MAAWTPTSSVVRFASARSRSRSASAEARRWPRIPESGIRCSIVTLTSAPPSMNGRWSSEGEIIGSSSAETMIGRASPARLRARAACISSLPSLARRMTSPRLSGDGSAGVVWAATGFGQVSRPTVRRRTNRRPVERCHVDHRMLHALRPGRRHIAGPDDRTSMLTGRRRQAACASRQHPWLPWPPSRDSLTRRRNARPPARSSCRGRYSPSRRAHWRPRYTASPTSGSTPRDRGDRQVCSPWPPGR